MAFTEFVFFDASSTEAYSNVFRNLLDCGTLVFHVQSLADGSAAFDIDIEGQVDLESDDWRPYFAVNKSNISVGTKITKPGIYTIDMTGVRNLRLKNNGTAGNVKVFAVLISD